LKKSPFCILATDRQTNRWTGPLHEAALAVASGGLITADFRSVLQQLAIQHSCYICIHEDVKEVNVGEVMK